MYLQIFRFAMAGAAGFLVDVGLLYMGLAVGLGYFFGRIISFLCAVWVTWQINRRFTFIDASDASLWQEWWRYLIAMSGGGAVNYACYSIAILLLPDSIFLPLYAISIATTISMIVNFAAAKLWVFK